MRSVAVTSIEAPLPGTSSTRPARFSSRSAAPGLADEYGCARAQSDDEGDKEKHHRKEHRCCGKSIGADHLTDIDAVDGPEQRLQNIAQHHRREEEEKGLPVGQSIGHGHFLCIGGAINQAEVGSVRSLKASLTM